MLATSAEGCLSFVAPEMSLVPLEGHSEFIVAKLECGSGSCRGQTGADELGERFCSLSPASSRSSFGCVVYEVGISF